MLIMRLPRGLVSASALTAMLLVAGAAQAVGTFDSLNGDFTFTNFSITGSADALANYSIEATDNGFDIILANDGLTVSGSPRDLVVQYDVISDSGPITQAFLSFEASFTGFGSLATVSEDYFTEVGGDLIPPGLVVYTNFAASQFEDSQSIPGYSSLHVKKDILVTSPSLSESAGITRVSQGFGAAPIPEPTAGVLFMVGVGLIAVRLRRS